MMPRAGLPLNTLVSAVWRDASFLSAARCTALVVASGQSMYEVPICTASAPRELFRLKGPLPGNPNQWKHITADGQRFIFAVPQPATATR